MHNIFTFSLTMYVQPFDCTYIDNVLIIASDPMVENIQHVHHAFECFRQFGMVINLNKCEFNRPKFVLLGYRISSSGIFPLLGKVKTIDTFPVRVTMRQ